MSKVTFSHRNVEILLLDNGMFSVVVNGQRIKRASLAGIKKVIDDAAKNVFKVFNGIAFWHFRGASGPLFQRVRVEGMRPGKRKGRFFSRPLFEVRIWQDKNTRMTFDVLPDTPKTVALLKRIHKLTTACDRSVDMYQSKIDPLTEELQRLQIKE